MGEWAMRPLHPSLGAEITGLDLAAPIDAATRAALERALAERLVLIFRDQDYTPERFLAAAQVFGPPMRQHYSQHNMPAFPDVGVVSYGEGRRGAEQWHTDHTNRERPPLATLLYGVEVPSQRGGTSIANMRAAYAALPEPERRQLEGLRTLNRLDRHRTEVRAEDRDKYDVPISHPLVRSHPVHGTKAVYFHITKSQVEGMAPEASQAFLASLLERLVQPELVYHHAWQPRDLLVLDNRATMHRGHTDHDPAEPRVLWRIIVEGDRPVLVA
jgi:taurine dioxygenase